MIGNVGKMMKQIQKMQGDMAKVQDELKNMTVEATSGGGVVKVVANGQQQVVGITISPDVVDPNDVEMLQDLILAAANEVLRKAQEMAAGELAKVTGNLNIPGLPPGLL